MKLRIHHRDDEPDTELLGVLSIHFDQNNEAIIRHLHPRSPERKQIYRKEVKHIAYIEIGE